MKVSIHVSVSSLIYCDLLLEKTCEKHLPACCSLFKRRHSVSRALHLRSLQARENKSLHLCASVFLSTSSDLLKIGACGSGNA